VLRFVTIPYLKEFMDTQKGSDRSATNGALISLHSHEIGTRRANAQVATWKDSGVAGFRHTHYAFPASLTLSFACVIQSIYVVHHVGLASIRDLLEAYLHCIAPISTCQECTVSVSPSRRVSLHHYVRGCVCCLCVCGTIHFVEFELV
jgi:hypothetical protein